MAIDQSKLGQIVQEQMEAIEADHPDDNCELGDVVVIAQVVCRPDHIEVRVRGAEGMLNNARVGLIAQALRNELFGPMVG